MGWEKQEYSLFKGHRCKPLKKIKPTSHHPYPYFGHSNVTQSDFK